MEKNVLITGASTGIGRSTAVEMVKNGFTVYAGVRNEKDFQAIENEGIVNLKPIVLDVSKSADIQTVTAFLSKEIAQDGLCALINNAGINYIAPFELFDEIEVRKLMEVNVFGMMNLSKAMIPLLQTYVEKSNQTAKIINIGSIGSKIGLPWEFSYHTSKFAVLGMSQSMYYELDALKIKVSCVMPGGIRTPFFAKSGQSSDTAKKALSGSNSAYYERNMTKMWDAAVQFERFATEPIKVAKTIQTLIEKRNPPLKKVVGVDAKIINFLVWLGWENILKSQFVKS